MPSGPGRKTTKIIRARRILLHSHQKGICFWCPSEVPLAYASVDELIPRSKGGTQRWDNIVMSCEPCNGKRGNDPAPFWALEVVRLRGRPE